MSLVEHLRAMARNNAWSNYRLLRACEQLRAGEFEAERVSFFPSIQRTLNHILIVDWYYIDALEGGGRGTSVFDDEIPCPTVAALIPAQTASDRRLMMFCDGLTPARLEQTVQLDRGDRIPPPETVQAILAHLFVHQIHHRGQAHAMLAGTSVKPPQLDEFFMADDAARRAAEIRALGLRDAAAA